MQCLNVAITGAWSLFRAPCCTLPARPWLYGRLPHQPPCFDPDLFEGAVRHIPFDFSPGALEAALEGIDVLASAYWARHDRPPAGHRGPWLSHAGAVERSGRLVEAARNAGVKRLVWTSIANPGLTPTCPITTARPALASSLEGRVARADLDLFLSYLTRTQGREGIDTFKEAMQDHGIDIGGQLMTYAQELLAEGEAKGRSETQVEVVEGLLRVGVTWEVIEAATGLTEADFQALKGAAGGHEFAGRRSRTRRRVRRRTAAANSATFPPSVIAGPE